MALKKLSFDRISLVKILALLSLIRWYNIVVTAMAQYLTALFVFNYGTSKYKILLSLDVHLIVLSTSFIIAGGYIVNAFYDYEKDMINRPQTTVFDRLISKEFALRCYLLFTAAGLILSAFTTLHVLLYFVGFSGLLWFYSHKLQKITFVREVASSVLSVLSVLSIGLYFHHVANIYLVLLYAAIILTFLFIRELVKGLLGMKGDMAFGYRTITVRYGLDASRVFIHLVSFFSLMLMVILVLALYKVHKYYVAFLAIETLILVVINGLIRSGKRIKWKWADLMVRLLIIIGILFIIFV